MTNREKAIEHTLKHIEDFGEAKYTRTGELHCVGRLHYNCVNLAAVMDIIKIMEGKEVDVDPCSTMDIKIAIRAPGQHVMYDRFIYEDREYIVWIIDYPNKTYVEGKAVKVDGKRQTVRAKIDECEWLLKKQLNSQ